MCVMTTRHRHGCIVVGRRSDADLLAGVPPAADAWGDGEMDPEVEGWFAHRAAFMTTSIASPSTWRDQPTRPTSRRQRQDPPGHGRGDRARQPDPQLAVRAAGGALRARAARPDRRGAAGPPAERVVHPGPGAQEGQAARRRAAGARLRRHGRAAGAEHPDQRHPPRGRAWRASNWNGVTPYTRKLLQHWADPRPGGPRAVLPARGGRDGDLPRRGRGPARHGRLPPPARARERGAQRRPAARRPEDGDRHRQDRRDGDADRLADDQQGRSRRATPASPSGSWSSRRASRSATGSACCSPSARTTTTASATSCRPTCGTRCCRRQVEIVNYHTFLPRDAKEIQGVAEQHPQAAATAGKPRSRRVPGDAGPGRRARSCATSAVGQGRDRRPQRRGPPLLPGQAARAPRRRRREGGQERNREARVWFRGLRDLHAAVGIKTDLRPVGHAVLPEGLRLQRGLHLPLGGQRLLADGRDRVGHREDPAHPGRRRRGRREQLVYLRPVGQHRPPLPEAGRAAKVGADSDWVPPGDARGRAAEPLPQLRAPEPRATRASSPRSASRRR